MRVLIIYIWLVTTILPTFSQWGTIAYYQVNKEYITRVLCENRDKPQLNCNGKCYLAKKLKSQKEIQDQTTSDMVQAIPLINLFASTAEIFDFLSATFSLHEESFFSYHLGTYHAPISILVPPPCTLPASQV